MATKIREVKFLNNKWRGSFLLSPSREKKRIENNRREKKRREEDNENRKE
jgi:hypothetical protein